MRTVNRGCEEEYVWQHPFASIAQALAVIARWVVRHGDDHLGGLLRKLIVPPRSDPGEEHIIVRLR